MEKNYYDRIEELEKQVAQLKADLDNRPINIDDFLLSWLNDVEIGISKCGNSMYYKKNGEIFAEYNGRIKCFFISYSKIWSVLESRYKMDDNSIMDYIENMLEKHYFITNIRLFSDRMAIHFWTK